MKRRRNDMPPPDREPSSGTTDSPIYKGIWFPENFEWKPGWDPEVPYAQRTVLLPNGWAVHPDNIPEEFRAQLEEEDRLRAEQYQEWLAYQASIKPESQK
jgi:hypothetical protein